MNTTFRLLIEKLRSLRRRRRLDREFDEELASHVELAIEEALARGLDPEQARREAIRRLGGLQQTRELHRETRGVSWLDAFAQDLTYAIRTLRRTPVFGLVVIASLALGIGANTAVFTLINAALFRALPVPHPEQLLQVTASPVLSFPMYRDLRARQQSFTDMLASSREWQVRVTLPAVPAPITLDNVPTTFVTANYFEVLGLRPRAGRFFVAQDEDQQRPNSAEAEGSVAVIGDAFWERHFGRDPDAIGRVIQVNRIACRIIGVAPPGFAGEMIATPTDLWVPVVPFSPANYLENRGGQFTTAIGRLKPGVTMAQARGAMAALFRELRVAEWNEHPSTRRRTRLEDNALNLTPVATGLDNGVRWRFSRPLWIVMGIVAAVLLIACANVANLLLARSTRRRHEFSLRLAMGCGRARLVRQLLTESLLLASLGAIAGVVVAYWATGALVALADAGPLDLRPDLTVILFVTATTVLTGIAFGLAPALRASRAETTAALNEHGRSTPGRLAQQRLSRTLVFAQVALSLVLLVAAGLLIRTIHNLGQVELGFQPAHVLMFNVAHIPRDGTPDALARDAYAAYERLQQVPGVESASLSTIPLFSDTDLYAPVRIRDASTGEEINIDARFNSVSPGYLETLGMTLVAGRTIQERDRGDHLVAVVNEALARRYFRDGSAVGRTMEISLVSMRGKPIEIVGVVRDAKYNNVRAETKPMFFRPIQQFPGRIRAIEVRTRAPDAAAVSVRQALLEAAPDIMVREVISLSGQIDRTLAAERLVGRLCTAFGALALLLASVGLYGVLSYGVAQRTGEIGIRMALGARPGDVLSMIVRQSLGVVAGGIAGGLLIAFTMTRVISVYLFGLAPTDAGTMIVATAVLLGAAALASYLPARRAARLDPVEALRRN